MEKWVPYKIVSEYFISQPFISLLKKRGGILLLTGFMLVMVSCSPTRYVGKDEYLLNKVKVRVEEKGVDVWKLTFDIDYEKAFKNLGHELKAPRSFNFTLGLKII